MSVAPTDTNGWRKSSYSGGSGNTSCVEVKFEARAGWHASSHSSGNGGGNCVEVAFVDSAVGVRDSKNTEGPTLAFPPTAWLAFAGSQAITSAG
jgi:hypothetical protein